MFSLQLLVVKPAPVSGTISLATVSIYLTLDILASLGKVSWRARLLALGFLLVQGQLRVERWEDCRH